MRQRLHWFALHGFTRGAASIAARRGDPQARLIADTAVWADPESFCDELHGAGPMIGGGAGHLAVGHALGRDILRSDNFRLLSPGSNLPAPLRWLERTTRDQLLHPLRPPSLLAVEPPDHTRYRAAVSSAFTLKAVSALHAQIAQTASKLLDQLADESDVVNIIDNYCWELPVALLSDILGVPRSDRALLRQFCEQGAPVLDTGLSWQTYVRVQTATKGICAWLEQHIQQLRRSPGDDLLSQLIKKADNEPAETRLNDLELQAVAGLILTAGIETTVNLLGNGIELLLGAPEQLRVLRQRPQLWPNAIQEILRLESPVQLIPRVARRDTEVRGTSIRRDELVLVYVTAANRDPSVFADPHRFDAERPNAGKHLAFSSGRHVCLGATLARDEAAIGLRTLFDRFPDMRAAGAGDRRDSRVLRGWSNLPVQLVPAQASGSRHQSAPQERGQPRYVRNAITTEPA